jgi:cation-transporting ATPase E
MRALGAFLALAPNQRRYHPGFLRRVLRFAIPSGAITAAAAYLGYCATRLLEAHATAAEARTTSTLIIVIAALWTLTILSRPVHGWRLPVLIGIAAIAASCAIVPPLGHDVFLIHLTPLLALISAALGAGAAVLVEIAYRLSREITLSSV